MAFVQCPRKQIFSWAISPRLGDQAIRTADSLSTPSWKENSLPVGDLFQSKARPTSEAETHRNHSVWKAARVNAVPARCRRPGGRELAVPTKRFELCGLAVTTKQEFDILAIGGSIAANVHGKSNDYGPLIESIRSFRLLKADGTIVPVCRGERGTVSAGCRRLRFVRNRGRCHFSASRGPAAN
jgi:hypothetical protein